MAPGSLPGNAKPIGHRPFAIAPEAQAVESQCECVLSELLLLDRIEDDGAAQGEEAEG